MHRHIHGAHMLSGWIFFMQCAFVFITSARIWFVSGNFISIWLFVTEFSFRIHKCEYAIANHVQNYTMYQMFQIQDIRSVFFPSFHVIHFLSLRSAKNALKFHKYWCVDGCCWRGIECVEHLWFFSIKSKELVPPPSLNLNRTEPNWTEVNWMQSSLIKHSPYSVHACIIKSTDEQFSMCAIRFAFLIR